MFFTVTAQHNSMLGRFAYNLLSNSNNSYRIKHFFLGNTVIYEARGQVILPRADNVYYTESIYFLYFYLAVIVYKSKNMG